MDAQNLNLASIFFQNSLYPEILHCQIQIFGLEEDLLTDEKLGGTTVPPGHDVTELINL